MDMKVSGLAIACMVATAAVSFLIPLALLWYVRKKKGADLAPFFVGCIVFVLFALVPLFETVIPVENFGEMLRTSTLAPMFNSGNLILSIMNGHL